MSSPNHPRPFVMTLISNLYRDSREKLILNPNTTQNFEDVLADLQNMVNIPRPPVKALYTEAKPHVKVWFTGNDVYGDNRASRREK